MDEQQVKKKMQACIDTLRSDLSSMRTGRATPAMVEAIQVSAYGGAQQLKVMEMASISSPDSETLVIDPWDKSVIGEIKQAILAANVGLNPNIDGDIIRISVPPMTGEDRQKHVKLLSTKIENAKVAVRKVRGDYMKGIKQSFENKEISEDEKHGSEESLQKATDEYVGKIDEIGSQKEKELLQV